MSKNEGRKIAIGALIAAFVGYLAGILTAKKPGKETRKDIVDKTVSIKNDTEKKIKELSSSLSDVISKAEAMLASTKTSVRDKLTAAIEQAKHAKDKTREALSSIHEGDFEDDDLKQAVKEAEDAIKHLKTFFNK